MPRIEYSYSIRGIAVSDQLRKINTMKTIRRIPFFIAMGVLALSALPFACAQTLNYSTTWLGNSFGGGEKWVQNWIDGMFVAPDGTIYTASTWDEAGREFGIYKDGDIAGQIRDTHGWGAGGGFAVTANDKYVFIAHSHGNEGGGLKGEQYPAKGLEWYGVSRRLKNGDHAPFDGGRGRFGDMLMLHEVAPTQDAHVRGLALRQNELFISDNLAGEIKVFDIETMKPLRSWKMNSPRQMAFDKWGALWILQSNNRDAAKLLRFARDGKLLPQSVVFAKDIKPTALCFAPDGSLLVTDNGPAQRVLIYVDANSKPRLAGTFGEKGGIYAGPVAGRVGPKRLVGPTGIGVDARGVLYVGGTQPATGTILRAFAPAGKNRWDKLQWELLGLEFVDSADIVPNSDGADVFTTENRYSLDWRKPVGQQWTWRSQTVNPFRFPNDPRLHEGHHDFAGALYRTLGGKPFLVVRGMFQHMMVIYKLQGETAVPSVMFAKGPYQNGNFKNIPQPQSGRWMWRDQSGDGDFQKDEFLDADGVRDPESWAWWMDENGGIWQGNQDGEKPIRYFSMQGFDAKGNPIYSRATSQTFDLPAPMNHLLRIEYLPQTDTMYLTGHSTERPKTGGEWGQVGTEVWRIDNWMKGNRTPRYRAALPYQPEIAESHPGVAATQATIKSFCVAGDYFFAVESRTAKVHVYHAESGAKVGEMSPGPEVSKQSGWVDFPDAMRAVRRKNGEYLIFVEEDWKGKIIVYRWKP
jgi:hypothetical protein